MGLEPDSVFWTTFFSFLPQNYATPEPGNLTPIPVPVHQSWRKQGTRLGVKRERDSTEEERQLTWGWGFVGGPITTEEDPEGQSDFNSGYHSAETEIISDSEDDLFRW